jgi:hypothetical protein
MAHFALVEIDSSGRSLVTRVDKVANAVLLDENGNELEALGSIHMQRLFGGEWVQTFFCENEPPPNHPRGKFAGIGDTWNGVDFIASEILP